MIKDKEYLATLSQEPTRPTTFKVGDKVTFTNSYGVVFTGKEVIGFKEYPNMPDRFIHIDVDCYWMPMTAESLTLEPESHCETTYHNLYYRSELRESVGFNVRFGGIDYDFRIPGACYPSNVEGLKAVRDEIIPKLNMDNLTHIQFKYYLLDL